MLPDPVRENQAVGEKLVAKLARGVALLPPGELAKLRRTSPGDTGSGPFWRLYYSMGLEQTFGKDKNWELVLQAIALLTPTGRPDGKPSAHDPSKGFGSVLHDLDVSETRILSLLSQTVPQRRVSLTRLTRLLAAKRARFDLTPMVRMFLFEARGDLRQLARDYYNPSTSNKAEQKSV